MKKYKANERFVLHEIADESILFEVENDYTHPEFAIVFNEAGAIMWNCLSEDYCTVNSLAEALCTKFSIDMTIAAKDAEAFLQKCLGESLINEFE